MSPTIEWLIDGHRQLAQACRKLERAADGPQLLEACDGLAVGLREHARQEVEVSLACAVAIERVGLDELAALAVNHGIERRSVWMLGRLCRTGVHDASELSRTAGEVLATLRQGIEQQEAWLLPLLRRVLDGQQLAVEPSSVGISDGMTVQEVLREYPQTQAVFDRLWLSANGGPAEPLDELAWSNGMDVDDLLAQLERAISVSGSWARRTRSARLTLTGH